MSKGASMKKEQKKPKKKRWDTADVSCRYPHGVDSLALR